LEIDRHRNSREINAAMPDVSRLASWEAKLAKATALIFARPGPTNRWKVVTCMMIKIVRSRVDGCFGV